MSLDPSGPMEPMPGLKHHTWFAFTQHGLRVYMDLRTNEFVFCGVEGAHPDHLRYLRHALAGDEPVLEDYEGPIMSVQDLKTLAVMDFDILHERESEEAA